MWPGAGHGVLTSGFGSGGADGTSRTSCCAVVDVCDVVALTVEQPKEKSESESTMERVMFMAREHEHGACHARSRSRAASIGRLHELVNHGLASTLPPTGSSSHHHW